MATGKKNVIAGLYDSFAYEKITVADTAIALTAATYTPVGADKAQKAYITVETAQIRYRLEGTPTTAEGHLLEIGDILQITGSDDIAGFKAIRTGATSASIKVTYSR